MDISATKLTHETVTSEMRILYEKTSDKKEYRRICALMRQQYFAEHRCEPEDPKKVSLLKRTITPKKDKRKNSEVL